MPVLFAFREDRFGFRFEVGDGALLGRSPECDLILFDRATSRKHARIVKNEDGSYKLQDLGSTNGTQHNDVRVSGEVPLNRNDEIKVGQEIFLFDPDLDVAVGREGAVLTVGEVEGSPQGAVSLPNEVDMSVLDRANLAPLFQVAQAMANRPTKGRVLKQTAYALTKIFGASSLALLWPESLYAQRLTAYLSRPEERRLVLPRPMTDLVLKNDQAVIWPYTYADLDFRNGERVINQLANSAMAVPLKAQEDRQGILYVESSDREYTDKDLAFLIALASLIAPALVNANLIAQLDHRLAQEEEELDTSGSFIGDEHQIKALLGTASQVATNDSRILLSGEVGTGKEVLARRIHAFSHRRRGPYVSVNCSTVPPGQLENALFGQEASADGEEGLPGILEKADGGTVFIRHVDHLSLAGQVELLRSIEEGLVYRVGSALPRPSNFRIVASSSRDLWEMIQEGEFREDLYQRLSEVVLEMPPLREIRGDIDALTRHFLDRAARERGLDVPEVDSAVADSLRAYPWPGNVGELKNVIDRMVMFIHGNWVVLDDLPTDLRVAPMVFVSMDDGDVSITETEKILLRRALARTNGNPDEAAAMLGLNELVFNNLLKQYNLVES